MVRIKRGSGVKELKRDGRPATSGWAVTIGGGAFMDEKEFGSANASTPASMGTTETTRAITLRRQ
jgi:hypothetical protein